MENSEGYTVLNLRPTRGNSAHLSPDGYQESPTSACCYKVALGALATWFVILTLLGITLGIWVFQGPTHDRPAGAAEDTPLEELVSHLRQRLCDTASGSSAGSSGCKLCPRDWLTYRNKCYWLSKASAFWSESWKDCETRTSQMLVIQDKEEMIFHRFPVTGSAEGNSCGMIRRNRINSESCNTEFKWICQTGAILL